MSESTGPDGSVDRLEGSQAWRFFLPLLLLAVAAGAEEENSRRGWLDRQLGSAESPAQIGRGAVPSDDELVSRGAVIGEILIRAENVFDPAREEEDKFLFRLANRLHVPTRSSVVEHKLLFREGDPYDPRVLRETGRYLRSLDYLYDARVVPVRYHGNRVDVLVVTRDVWTLSPGAGFERSGGENSFQLSLQEANLLGTGRFLELKYSDDPDRSTQRFRFVDTSLLGSRAELRLWYANTSDGHRRVFDLEQPFYALDSHWGAATKLISDQRQERIYRQGDIVQRFDHESTFGEIRGGLSKGLVGDRANRWLVGFTYDRDRFGSDDDSVAGLPIPLDRTLSYIWLGFESIEDEFIETRNMDQLARTEDWNLGTELRARLGWSSPTLGADKSQAIFSMAMRSGWQPGQGSNVFFSGYVDGRWGGEGHENVTVGGEMRFYLRNFGRHRLHATVRADAAWNLDPERQLLLGGDSGLRGYPLRFQDGDRRFLISLEQRFYTNWEVFNLIHVGAAVFLDMGRAWTTGEHFSGEDRPPDLGLLRDVGLGLRISSSRSAKGRMVHLDVAWPLDGDTDKIQWLITSRKTF